MATETQNVATGDRPVRDRVGMVVYGKDAATAVEGIVAAERAGVGQVWMTQSAGRADTLTLFAAAAVRTESVRLGTAIVPTFPRNPLALAQQALSIEDLAPGRLRLGIGPSHKHVVEGMYGTPMESPLAHLREYVEVLHALLWDGKADHHGRFFNIAASVPSAPKTPVMVSALRAGAFRLAGEVADGALTWMCPVPYLLETALPAMREGAAEAGRPVPPMIAHVPVALSEDRDARLGAARTVIGRYAAAPYYAKMFADAGFPVGADGAISDELAESLLVAGDEATVRESLASLLESGIDELLIPLVPVHDEVSENVRLAALIGGL